MSASDYGIARRPVLSGIVLAFTCIALATWLNGCARPIRTSEPPPPNWFHTPSDDGVIGAIGVSDRTTTNHSPQWYARKRALAGLLSYLQTAEGSLAEDALNDVYEGNSDELRVGGQTIRFAHEVYLRDRLVYAYAALASRGQLRKLEQKRNKPFMINPAQCQPAWVCQPTTQQLGGVVGVSRKASLPSRQYKLAFSNGVILLEYAYGVAVEGTQEFLTTQSSVGVLRVRQSDVRVNRFGMLPKTVRLYVKGVGFHEGNLYVWIVSPDLPPYEGRDDLSWLNSPSQNGRPGAVGQAQPTVLNLLSDQIHKAFARGVIELSAVANVRIDSELLNYQGPSSFFAQRIRSAVDAQLYPSLRGIYLTDGGDVSVWVVSQ